MRRLAFLILVALVAALGAPAAAHAQPTAGINATATILFPPLTAAGVRPLQFGAVIPGSPEAVLPNTPGSGEVRISGVRNRRSIAITLNLPSALRNASNQEMPISFNGNYAAVCEITNAGACDPVTYWAYNPVTTPTFIDTPDRARKGRPRYDLQDFSVYVGGAVQPVASQPAGTYTGTITVSIVAN